MLFDLSAVTHALCALLTDATDHSTLLDPPGGLPVTITVSGQHPQKPPTGNTCDLNLYLFHATQSQFLRNGFWQQSAVTGQPAGATARQPVAFEPLCLDLRFMLSAYSGTGWVYEQQVMGVAMRTLHDNATLRVVTAGPDGTPQTSQLTVGLESASWDELSRLWQALGGPMRMTALYRVGVALLAPHEPPAPKPRATSWHLMAGPGATGDASADVGLPQLYGTSRSVSYALPDLTVREYDAAPATAGPGQLFTLRGRELQDDTPVYLVATDADGKETETDVSATWKPAPAVPPGTAPLRLRVPDAAGCPQPGHYRLRVGTVGSPQWRSGAVPLSVAPCLDPTGGPLVLPGADGRYTVTARNVSADHATVLLDTIGLEYAGTAPGPGQWSLSGTTLTLVPPAGLSAGRYPIRLRVAGVEADPGLWAVWP
ncbi:DUF4255 domain-containing protein [Streptomyces sp. NPDC005549]|uniref:DUF4255 domain-containing protein n=1 Tax=Streptomyces sp. NPDC005549 TaxID=3154888 RepID=UPI0033A26E08